MRDLSSILFPFRNEFNLVNSKIQKHNVFIIYGPKITLKNAKFLHEMAKILQKKKNAT